MVSLLAKNAPSPHAGRRSNPSTGSTRMLPLCTANAAASRNPISMRERPQPKLFLSDLPEARESMRLDDQEEDDKSAEHHELEIRNGALRDVEAEGDVEKAHGDA